MSDKDTTDERDKFTDTERRNAAALNLALLHLQNLILVEAATGKSREALKNLSDWETMCKTAKHFEDIIGLDDLGIEEE